MNLGDLEKMDPKQKAFIMLALAAEGFFNVMLAEREKKSPGPAQAMRVLLEEGKAHIAVSIQSNGKELKAAIALAPPEFVDALDKPEMVLQASIAVGFADPQKLTITDLSKLN